jgi:hypothetical protein
MRDSVFIGLMLLVVAMLTASVWFQAARCVPVDEHHRHTEDAYERGYEEGWQAAAEIQTQTERTDK